MNEMTPRAQVPPCWAWVRLPFPPPHLAPQESFVRLRVVGPPSLIERTAREFAALGGWASESPSPTDRDGREVVLAGTVAQVKQLAAGSAAAAAAALETALTRALSGPPAMRLGTHWFDFPRRVYVAGILNNTPDSFHDRGRFFGIDAALTRAEEIVRQGADVIEVGGESAQAGERLDPPVEIDRVVPLVDALVRRYPLPVAVDTYKPDVARAAIHSGAVLINDIAGLREPGMAEAIAGSGAGVVIMHLHGRPKEPYVEVEVPSMMDWVAAFLRERIEAAGAAGIPRERILVDPGLDFGKRPQRDLELMRRLPELRNLGCPIFVATSRKDYIRDLLHLHPDDLLEGTAAAVAFAVVQGANMLRVHDVEAMVRVVRMTEHLAGYHGADPPATEERRDVTTR